MKKEFDLQAYLTEGVENIVKSALKATLKDPKESAFMLEFSRCVAKANKLRAKEEAEGLHVPSFLIASITSNCNLHCAGCYSRANHACVDAAPVEQLTDEEWDSIFTQASELGISFILLAGGEPMVRKGVIEKAGKHRDILFPIFTNGTLMSERYVEVFAANRNLLPVFSIEGDEVTTDARRGAGVYQKLRSGMQLMQDRKLIFGASVTVTNENLEAAVSEAFISSLQNAGAKAVFFIEYVPVTEESQHLAPGDAEREFLKNAIDKLREDYPEMVFVSFPGDEKSSGGCVAAGRGFFHINSHGGAEPCPFSPHSDINVKTTSLKDAINSKLFRALQENDILLEDHAGGCVLFEKKELVEQYMNQSAKE